LEGLLETVSLEMKMKSVGTVVHIQTAGGREFQILRAETLKLRAPNEVQRNGTESNWYLTTRENK